MTPAAPRRPAAGLATGRRHNPFPRPNLHTLPRAGRSFRPAALSPSPGPRPQIHQPAADRGRERAMVAARAVELRARYEREAKERLREAQERGRQRQKGTPVNFPESNPPASDTRDRMGELFSVSGKTVDYARRRATAALETRSAGLGPIGALGRPRCLWGILAGFRVHPRPDSKLQLADDLNLEPNVQEGLTNRVA